MIKSLVLVLFVVLLLSACLPDTGYWPGMGKPVDEGYVNSMLNDVAQDAKNDQRDAQRPPEKSGSKR